jgi:hypothetical protein
MAEAANMKRMPARGAMSLCGLDGDVTLATHPFRSLKVRTLIYPG